MLTWFSAEGLLPGSVWAGADAVFRENQWQGLRYFRYFEISCLPTMASPTHQVISMPITRTVTKIPFFANESGRKGTTKINPNKTQERINSAMAMGVTHFDFTPDILFVSVRMDCIISKQLTGINPRAEPWTHFPGQAPGN